MHAIDRGRSTEADRDENLKFNRRERRIFSSQARQRMEFLDDNGDAVRTNKMAPYAGRGKVAPDIIAVRSYAELSGLNNFAIIADDIFIAGSGKDEAEAIADHNRNLRALLNRCREKGIKLNKQAEIESKIDSLLWAAGRQLNQDGIRPIDPLKVEAINARMPNPVNRQGVIRLIGFTTYPAKFFPNFSDITIHRFVP